MDNYHLKPMLNLLTRLLIIKYNESVAASFYSFWDYYLSQIYINPKRPKIFLQHFALEYRFNDIKETMLLNIDETAKYIANNLISVKKEKYNSDNYYYTDMRKGILFNKLFFQKKNHKYPIIALFFPAVSPQNKLRMNCIIEGNHRVTNAAIKNETIEVIRINTILVPLNMFNRTRDWLLYIMIANFYEIVHKPEMTTSYKNIGNHLIKDVIK